MSAVLATAERLSRALDCLLIEGFTIQDKTLLEKLLTGLNDADDLLNILPIDSHRKWFATVLDVCQRRQSLATRDSSVRLYAFALKYLAVLVKRDNRLVALVESRTLQSLIEWLDVSFNLKESSVFNAYMSLLQALNNHKCGVEYVFQEGLWKYILVAIRGLIVPAKYIEIQSTQYIADLIYKAFEYGMAHYCEPLLDELFSNLNFADSLIVNMQAKELITYNIYTKILILSLEKFIGTKYELEVCDKIIYRHSLSDILLKIEKLLNVTPILLKNYMTLHLLFDYFTSWHCSNMECILTSIFSFMNTPKNIHLYKKINNLYMQALRYANNNTQLKVNTEFEKELVLGQLIPLRKCTEWLKCCTSETSKFDDSCIIESKLILNYCNSYDSVINEVAISSILNILDSVPILKQDSLEYLVTFFSTLTDRFFNSDNWLNPYHDSTYYKFLDILSYVFICWTKILEYQVFCENDTPISLSVPLVHSHSQFFQKSSHNVALLQNGLKLISTALNKLNHNSVQSTDNIIAFDKLCITLSTLLLDTRPEIRDSCLECISSLIVSSKYFSGHILMNLILEKKMPISVLNVLKHDNDPFVRSKALECLEKMVSVSDVWEGSFRESDLINHCLNLMQYESEGIIRRQVVKLITSLFVHNALSDKLFYEICTVMVHISIKDPLWEVKTFSYEFWEHAIQIFVTKSDEVNNIERLNVNLFKLSATGCLHVLYVALKEEHDLVVQKRAICLAKELFDFINSIKNITEFEFKLKSNSINYSSNVNENLENYDGSKQKKMRQIDSADIILNSITTSYDCELLPTLKSGNNSNIYPNDVCLCQKTDAYISIDDFLNFISIYDFNDCDAKTQWVIFTRCGLDSMLEDIISQSQNCFIEGAEILDCH